MPDADFDRHLRQAQRLRYTQGIRSVVEQIAPIAVDVDPDLERIALVYARHGAAVGRKRSRASRVDQSIETLAVLVQLRSRSQSDVGFGACERSGVVIRLRPVGFGAHALTYRFR